MISISLHVNSVKIFKITGAKNSQNHIYSPFNFFLLYMHETFLQKIKTNIKNIDHWFNKKS